MKPSESGRHAMHRSLLLASVAAAAMASVPVAALAQAAPDPAAWAQAEAAYRAMNEGAPDRAAEAARLAVAASPDNLEWRLLLADALSASGRHAEALEALQPVAGVWDHRVQTRRAEAARQAGDLDQAAEAYGQAAALAPEMSSRAYLVRARVQVLVQADRIAEARQVLSEAFENNILPGDAPADAAYAAVSVGDDPRAVQAFRAADDAQPLQGSQALDAGYAARRAGQDEQAVRWLERGVTTLPPEQMTPQRRHEIGREIEALENRFGGSVSVSTGPAAESTHLLSSGGESVTQAGGEAWMRLGGDNNGRPVQAFVRAYGTLDGGAGATGYDSVQGWIGLRWKPLSETNLLLEASRMVPLGDQAIEDTMLRAAWSGDWGGDLRYDRDSWPSARLYADVARLLDAERTFAIVDGTLGWTWVASASRRDIATVGAAVRSEYDSARADELNISAGPRVSWRRWLGGSATRAPGAYLDLSLTYLVPLDDQDRDDGLAAVLTLGF